MMVLLSHSLPMFKCRFMGSTPRCSDQAGLCWGQTVCIFDSSGFVDAAGQDHAQAARCAVFNIGLNRCSADVTCFTNTFSTIVTGT